MRYVSMVLMAILASLIAIPSVNLAAHSSLNEEIMISSVGNIHIQGNFGETILFEYGAETGILQPPFDRFTPQEAESGNEITVDTAHVRTGIQALNFYNEVPTKVAGNVGVFKDMSTREFYCSWWMYFDNRWLTQDTNGWGSVPGGWGLFFGTPQASWTYELNSRFCIHPITRQIMGGAWCDKLTSGTPEYCQYYVDNIMEVVDTGYYVTDYLNQWVHFQVYVKMTDDYTGVIRQWFNNNLVFEKTGIKLAPESFAEWRIKGGAWCWTENPHIVVELYQSVNSFESWVWADDIVVSSEKVPETYGVYK